MSHAPRNQERESTMTARHDRKKKRVDILHFLESCHCAVTEIDSNSLLAVIRHGREDLTETESDLRTATQGENEAQQLEIPGFRNARLQAMAVRTESLTRALDSLEADAIKRGLTLSPRQNAKIEKDGIISKHRPFLTVHDVQNFGTTTRTQIVTIRRKNDISKRTE
jgi:hypothetical protein